MKLEWIQLDNFRQYFGKQRLVFSKDEQRNVTVIHGINGAGKTSLFMALNWCLYGRSVDEVIVVDNVGELVSKECLARTAIGGRAYAAVELSFLHEGERYSLRRAVYTVKQAEGIATANGPEDFVMMRTRADGQAITVKNPLGTLNAILPANVREYFLFDGEKIDNFARPEAAMQVRQAIYLVLKLELLSRAQKHLDINARDYRAELKQTSGPELRRLLEQEERARDERNTSMQRIEELKRETASARDKIAEIDARLGETQNAKLLKERRGYIEQNLRTHRTELEATTSQIRDIAIGFHFILARPAIDAAMRVLDIKRERGEIPSSIRQQFVQDLLEQGRCICGRCLDADTPERDRLVKLMHGSLSSALENDILETSMALRGFVGRTRQHADDIRQYMQVRVNLIDQITGLSTQFD